ncbi:hypothetical protein [Actinokineospora spheciospongiae]|nr:hypothetical protein [Actinokineospora spheciospongiae]PWW67124.1 hypothetical protein DFQ13_101642 [Actinokineospora spheciospongiae]
MSAATVVLVHGAFADASSFAPVIFAADVIGEALRAVGGDA